jgi:uncharacterized membrane protein
VTEHNRRQTDLDAEKSTTRLEAFSDGVFAIAITLLVLDFHVPPNLPPGTHLTDALLGQWPVFLGFLSSFATIGIMWINHHRMFDLIRCSDHTLLILNLLLLLGITFVPYPTALMAQYLGQPEEQTAVFVYIGTFIVIATIFNGLWGYASRSGRLLGAHVNPEAVTAITRQYRFGPLLYFIALLIAWVQPTVAILFTLLLAIYFALPSRMV